MMRDLSHGAAAVGEDGSLWRFVPECQFPFGLSCMWFAAFFVKVRDKMSKIGIFSCEMMLMRQD